jgi:hypothetical protein
MKSKIWCLGLVTLTLLLGTGCSRLANKIQSIESPKSNASSNEPRKTKYILGDFTPINGTDNLTAPVYQDYSGKDRSSEYSSYSSPSTDYYDKKGGGGSIHNVVIINRQNLSSRKLFANNKSMILDEQKLGESTTEGGKTIIKNIQALMYRVAKADTNGDKSIDQRDKQEIALADVDGTNYKELITGIDRVINIHSQSKDKRVVFYRTGQEYFAASIDIPSRSVTVKKLESIAE